MHLRLFTKIVLFLNVSVHKENIDSSILAVLANIVREYVFYVFFENPKNATFYVFLKRHLKKRKKT